MAAAVGGVAAGSAGWAGCVVGTRIASWQEADVGMGAIRMYEVTDVGIRAVFCMRWVGLWAGWPTPPQVDKSGWTTRTTL